MARSGQRELNYTWNLNTEQALKKAKEAVDQMRNLNTLATKAVSAAGGQGVSTAGITALQQANLALKKQLIDAQVETQRLRSENVALSNTYREGQISAQQFRAEQARIRAEQRALIDSQREARRNFQAAAGSYYEAAHRLSTLGRAIKAAEGGFNSNNPIVREQVKEYNRLNQALKDFDAQMGNHQRNVGNYPKQLNGVIGSLKSLAAGYLSINGAISLINASFSSNVKAQAIQASLQYTLGSLEEANNKIDELRANALKYGQDFLPIADTYSKFAGAARAANFPLAETDRIFKAVLVTGARFNLTSDQMSGALLALQQMISKGTVQAEELRGQLGERLPGAFSLAAKAMGVSEKKLGDLLKNGDVLASDLLPKLATQLEKTFGLKPGEQVDNLNSSVNRLSTTVDTALEGEGIGKLFKQFVDGAANAVTALDRLLKSRSFGEVMARLFTFDGGGYNEQNFIRDTYDSGKKLTSNFNPIGSSSDVLLADLKSKSLTELETLRNSFIKAGNEAATAVNIYKAGLKSGKLDDDEERSLKSVEQNFKTIQSQYKIVNTAYQLVKKSSAEAKTATKELADDQLTSVKEIQKRISALSGMPGSAIEGSEINNRIDALKARLKELNGTQTGQYKSALKARNDLQKSIDDLTKKGTDKQLSADEQEVESVKKKYTDMKKAADAFNNRPENIRKGLRVDAGGLTQAKNNEIAALADKQDAEKLKVTLDNQNRLYDEYENYKSKVGEEEADKRYSKELNNYATYLEALKAKRDSLLNQDQKSKGGNETSRVAIQQQLKVVDDQIAAEEVINKKRRDEIFADAFQAAMTYSQALESIQKEFDRRISALGSSATEEQLKNLNDARRQQMDGLGEETIQRMDAYRELYENIDILSTKQALKDIQTLRETAAAMLALGRISVAEFQRIFRNLDEAEAKVKDKLPAGLQKVASEFGNLSNEVGKFDEGLGRTIGTLGNILNSVASIKDNLNKFKAPDSNIFGKISSGIGILGAAVGFISSIGSLFDKSKERAEQQAYAAELQVKATEALNKVLERQLALTKEIYGPERLAAYRKNIDDIKKAQIDATASLAGLVTLSSDPELNEIIKKRNNGEDFSHKFANTERKDYEDYINQLKRTGQYIDLTTQSVEQLTVLMQSGKLDEKTSAIVQNLINLEQQARDTLNAYNEEITGINFSSLNDEIKSVFESGEASAENFAAAIEKSIKGAFSNAFRRNEIEKAMQPFYNQLAKAGEDNVFSDEEIATLRNQREAISKVLADKAAAYQKILGDDSLNTAKSDTLKGQITGITEDTGNKLVGAFNGMRLVQLQTNVLLTYTNTGIGDLFRIATDNLKTAQQIATNTKRSADTGDTYLPYLKDIAGNTKDSLASQLRAAGKYGY